MSMTNYAAKATKQGGGVQWTEEQKNAYQACWDVFKTKMAKRRAGQTRDFDAVCIEIGPSAAVTREFKGVSSTTQRRDIKVELREPGLEMLRWQESSADNPFNDKTLLHQLIVAVTGIVPQQEEGLSIDFNDLLNRPIRVTIERQSDRSDGQRGGFYSKLRGISPRFDDDDDETPAPAPTPLPKAALTPPPANPKRVVPANPTPATQASEEPWDDDE